MITGVPNMKLSAWREVFGFLVPFRNLRDLDWVGYKVSCAPDVNMYLDLWHRTWKSTNCRGVVHAYKEPLINRYSPENISVSDG